MKLTVANLRPSFILSRHFLSLAISFALVLPATFAQNAPLCFQLFFPTAHANNGDTVCLPLRVRDFNAIVGMQFEVHWDASKMEFSHLEFSPLPGLGPIDFNTNFPDRLRFAWFDPAGMGITLPDSSVIFTLCLRVTSNEPGFYPVTIEEAPPNFLFEVIQLTLPDWSAVLLPMTQQIGGVSIGGSGTSDLALTSTCVAEAICNAHSGSASVEVGGGVPPYQYQWSGPNGFTGSTAMVTNLQGGTYSVTVTDQNGTSVVGLIEVNATPSGLWVSKQLTPAFCGQPSGCAALNVSGGHPPYTFIWSAGSSTTNESCGFLPGIHIVSIMDSAGCTRLDSFFIANDSFVKIDVVENHITECNGTGSASAQVLQGMPPYEFLWSTGDTTSAVQNLHEGIYTLTVTTPGGCTAFGSTWITDISVLSWNLQLLRECIDPLNTPEGNVFLRFNPNGGISFPALVSWSDGSTRLIPEKPVGNIMDTLAGVPSGYYSATVTDVKGCTKTTQAVLNCAPPLPVPDSITAFYVLDEYLNPQYGLDSCAGVFARYFNEVISMEIEMTWDSTRMAYKQLKNLNPALGLDLANFNVSSANTLRFNWSDAASAGISLSENSLLFEVCYTPNTTLPNVQLNFSKGRVWDNTNGESAFLGKNGHVLFDLYFPPEPSVCEYAATLPACASDGYGRILLGRCDANKLLSGYYFHDDVYYNDLAGLMFADSGTYRISASQFGQSGNSFYAHIPYSADNAPCAWPGDADDNNAVNHHDLLYIGLAYDAIGGARPGASLDWYGQACADWAQTTVTRDVNYKNIDTNGDGIVNADDTLAIVQNWGRVVNPAQDNPYDAPLGNPTGNPLPPFTIQTDTLAPGEAVALPILIGSDDMPADSIYGVAFSISYDPKKVRPTIHFEPNNSWLGDKPELLWLQKNYPGLGRLDVAVTRTDGMPVSGSGVIGDVLVIIEDDIFFHANGAETEKEPDITIDSIAKTTLFFSGLHSVNIDAAPNKFDAPPVDIYILKTTTTVQEPPKWERNLTVSPNPASESLHINSPNAMIRRTEITSPTGAMIAVQHTNFNTVRLPVHNLPMGTYFVRIFTDAGVAVRKVSIVR